MIYVLPKSFINYKPQRGDINQRPDESGQIRGVLQCKPRRGDITQRRGSPLRLQGDFLQLPRPACGEGVRGRGILNNEEYVYITALLTLMPIIAR